MINILNLKTNKFADLHIGDTFWHFSKPFMKINLAKANATGCNFNAISLETGIECMFKDSEIVKPTVFRCVEVKV